MAPKSSVVQKGKGNAPSTSRDRRCMAAAGTAVPPPTSGKIILLRYKKHDEDHNQVLVVPQSRHTSYLAPIFTVLPLSMLYVCVWSLNNV